MNNQAAQTMPLPEPWTIRYNDDATGREIGPPTPLYTADQMHQYARDCALSQTAGVVDGWKLVPVEPTTAMRNAAFCALEIDPSKTQYLTGTDARDAVWNAMVRAAPAASGGEHFPGGDIGVGSCEQTEQYRRENPPPALTDGVVPDIAAAERLCRIYFEIAAEAVGEEAVRTERDRRIAMIAAAAKPSGE